MNQPNEWGVAHLENGATAGIQARLGEKKDGAGPIINALRLAVMRREDLGQNKEELGNGLLGIRCGWQCTKIISISTHWIQY
jgi:hypothetical protein